MIIKFKQSAVFFYFYFSWSLIFICNFLDYNKSNIFLLYNLALIILLLINDDWYNDNDIFDTNLKQKNIFDL